jgi:diaminopropionate ammonia-lyase
MVGLYIPLDTPRARDPLDGVIDRGLVDEACAVIPRWPGYAPTPLDELAGLARHAGVASVTVKDEAGRFGLGSFKALGGAFAVWLALKGLSPAEVAETTAITASDGNHGLSVAWGARRFGCRCKIYLHENVSAARAGLIEAMGAEVVRVAGNYDDSTHQAMEDARVHGWTLVSDTALGEADQQPGQVMAGYGVMLHEIAAQAVQPPTHVFIQGGCGGLAAAVFGLLQDAWVEPPRFIVVEPEKADCLFQSARAGGPVRIHGDLDTIMAGLSVGEPSATAWKTIWRTAFAYLTISDEAAIETMRILAEGRYGDPPRVVGDAGAAGLAGFLAVAADPQLRAALDLSATSRVLTILTEGAVDAEAYARFVGRDPAAVVASAGRAA